LLEVSDEGPGIPSAEQKLIFGKFYRIGNEETRKHKGTGLGLYLVKNIARFHGATVEVKSRQPRGTTFEVSFPIQQQQ
jgi:signal transduction histidine kinase